MGITHEQFVEYLQERSLERWAKPVFDVRPSRAVATIVHDESFFFPIWLAYYSRFFAPEDIYVLDHDTTDGSTNGEGFTRIPVSHDSVDHQWMVDTVMELQHDLQQRYDVVLFTDVDEIIAPDPDFGTLGDLIDRFDEPFVQCVGKEILHRPDTEAAYDANQPIMSQRHSWFANLGYNKPLLATVPMNWIPGFHGVVSGEINQDPNLYLIHLHRLDYEQCRLRHALRRRRQWNAEDMRRGYAAHNLLDAGEGFDQWFNSEKSVDEAELVVERIPDRWRGIF